tara:strand:+ start:120 stop:755 length:636 start_codon:yes stop_codon:yes gene_type:complete
MKYNKVTYTLIGLTLTLALSICLFEYKTISTHTFNIKSSLIELEDEEVIEINKPITPPPPPPPVSIPEVVEVVKDEKIIDKPILLLDPELDVDIIIEIEEESEPIIEVVFDVVEENPEFIGGIQKLYEYLGNNIYYPEMAKENGIQGKVFVQFVVWKDGTIRDVKVVKGVHKTLNTEALRVINEMPKWKPGKQRGKNVNARFTLPIKFRIS